MKFRITCFALIIFISFSSNSYCQNDESVNNNNSSFGASLGINEFHQRDKYLSPYIFSGMIFASRLSYEFRTEKNINKVDAFFSTGSLNSDIQPRNINHYVGYISYSFLHQLVPFKLGDSPIKFSIGGGFSSFLENTDFYTDEIADVDHSWYWSHSLNLLVKGDYQLDNRKNIFIQLTLPAVKFVSRPQNGHLLNDRNSEVNKNFLNAAKKGRLELLWKNPVFILEIGYRQPIGDKLDFFGTYMFGYTSSNRPDAMLTMNNYMNNLLIGIELIF